MSDLRIQIRLNDEPKVIVAEFTIDEDEFDNLQIWQERLLTNIKGAIEWERYTRKNRND